MSNSRERIIEAATAEVSRKGPLGLRVQDVASSAGVSVPLIYKYFEDRDGLLVEALGGMFEKRVLDFLENTERFLAGLDGLTVEAMVEYVTAQGTEANRESRWLRIQVLSASMEIPALRERIREAQLAIDRRADRFWTMAQEKIIGGVDLNPRLFGFLLQSISFGLVLNDLHDGEDALSDEDFRTLLNLVLHSSLKKSH